MLSIIIFITVMLVAITLVIFYVNSMKQQNISEKDVVEGLKKRIDELDNDNVDTDSNSTAKIIVPDAVDPDESTRVSTQNEECKVYEVGPKQKIEKTVIGSDKKEKVFENTEIERVDHTDDPIKENEGFISKIIKTKNSR